ncbi:MAG: hypothetical protein ACOZAM_25440 [Pseudomonadota bacterium]
MIDEAGAAYAAAEPSLSSWDAGGGEAPLAGGAAESAGDRATETARESLDRAFASLEASARDETADARERDEPDRPKSEEGSGFQQPKRSDRQSAATMEPPARFSLDAKAAWKNVPDAVKGEVGRAFRELETGLNQYQQAFEPLKPYYLMAQQRGVSVADALRNYVALDQALVSDEPTERLAAIEHLLDCAGVSPKEYAAFIMGQPADQARSDHDRTIRELRQHVTYLQNQLGGVAQSIQQRHEDEALRQVEAFADTNPRLKEPDLQNTVLRLLETRMATDLQSAYDMATRLNPVSVGDARIMAAASTAATTKPNPAQTRNGNLSITGAPGSGSNPAKRRAPATARESVDTAFASLGLG